MRIPILTQGPNRQRRWRVHAGQRLWYASLGKSGAAQMEQYARSGSIRLRDARAADAAALAEFAARVFADTFGPDNAPDDMAIYLAEAFGPDKQAAEIADPTSRVILAVSGDGDQSAMVGYSHFLFEEDGESVLLKRLYLDAGQHGRGLAHRLLEECVRQCRAAGAGRLWLTVWDQNPRAIAFYKKSGFVVSGETTFTLGSDVQTDLQMEMDLTAI